MLTWLSNKLRLARATLGGASPVCLAFLLAIVVRVQVIAPLLRQAVSAPVVAVGAILQAAVSVALLGPVDARAGATTFVQSPANPVRGSVGTRMELVFTYTGAPTPPQSFLVTGTLPPGLEFEPPGLNGGVINAPIPVISGTPEAPGIYSIFVEGYDGFNATGHTNNVQQEIRFEISGEAAQRAPTFTTQPVSQTVNAGVAVTFVAAAEGVPSPVLQWLKNGTPISGATGNVLTIVNAQLADAATYTAEATNAAGRAVSAAAVLTVNAGQSGRPAAVVSDPRDLIVSAGGTAVLTVVAIGQPAPTYQWRKNHSALIGETTSQLVLREVSARDSAAYDVLVSNAAGSVTSSLARLEVVPGGESRLVNLSVRTRLSAGGTFIAGFVAQGRRSVLLRAIGPTLAGFDVAGWCADPRIAIVDAAGATVARNEDWDPNLASVFSAAGAFSLPSGTKDAAVLHTLSGAQSAVVMGADAGIVLVEGYDTGAGDGQLANLSARAAIGTGDDVLLAGFVVTGATAKTVLVRGVGPALGVFGVSGALGDPQLEILTSTGRILATNDDWAASLGAVFTQTGAFALPASGKDAALLVTLAPGAYTAKLSGVGGATGEGLLEIYTLR